MAPAVGILIARRLDQNWFDRPRAWPRATVAVGLAASAVLALIVARGDFLLASAIRLNAEEVCAHLFIRGNQLVVPRTLGIPILHAGAWGAGRWTQNVPGSKPATTWRRPTTTPICFRLTPVKLFFWSRLAVPETYPLTTFNQPVGAGFYSSIWGPLPFAFGRVPPESVSVYVLQPSPPAIAKN